MKKDGFAFKAMWKNVDLPKLTFQQLNICSGIYLLRKGPLLSFADGAFSNENGNSVKLSQHNYNGKMLRKALKVGFYDI